MAKLHRRIRLPNSYSGCELLCRLRSRAVWLVKKSKSQSGQSTVEYAIVCAALLCVVVALGALMNVVRDGVFVEHAKTSASHSVEDSAGGFADVFSY